MNSKFFTLLITDGLITIFLLYDSARSDRSDIYDTVTLLQQKRNKKKKEVTFTFTDMSPKEGVNLYYVRFLQENGEVAWSSPMWVNDSR